jgi:penicillin-binding protein 2
LWKKLWRAARRAGGDQPETGDILAYVSRPGYDPNLFVDGIDAQSWDELNNSAGPCSTARCPAPMRRVPPSSPSWRWPRWNWASARRRR